MGTLITRVKLPKQISLTNWGVTEDGVDINGIYDYISFPSPITSFPLEGTESGVTYNLYASENGSEYSLIYSGGTPIVQGYKHSSLESYMFYDGSQWVLWFDGIYQWVNPNGTQNTLRFNNWQIYIAQGPAGNIEITDSSIKKNISFSVKTTNTGKVRSNENYILNSKFDADNQYPIADGSLFFDSNYPSMGNCNDLGVCTILSDYTHNSPLFYEGGFNYHTFANRTFHEINAPYNTLPIGHPIQPRLLKMFGAGSKFGRADNLTNYLKTITNTTSFSPSDAESWTKYGVEQVLSIPSWATKVVYGVKYLAKSDDLFRENNFAGLKLNFRTSYSDASDRNYVNIHLIRRSTASAVDTLESLYGSNVYLFFDANSSSNAMCQWLGPQVSRVKIRKRSSTNIDSNTDQFIKIKDTIDIPIFSSSGGEPDFGNSRPEFLSLEMFFAEWVSYLNNDLVSSGSIYFYEPFIYFV